MNVPTFQIDLNSEDLRIGIVRSRFNEEVGDALLVACVTELKQLGVLEKDILVATVPGALEIPLTLQKMAESEQFDALIAIGSVIRGETYHFEIVANESATGLNKVALEYSIPIANAILTTEDEDQAMERAHEKGTDAARVAVEMANLVFAIEGLSALEGEDDA